MRLCAQEWMCVRTKNNNKNGVSCIDCNKLDFSEKLTSNSNLNMIYKV